MLLYKTCCILRILLVLCPQTGYIHPDEHFQGPEVVYGDIAEFKVLRTWEFSSSKPIRSIIFPYIVSVIPAAVIRLLKHLQYDFSAYLLLVLPRLIMCVFSFIIDICIYKTCITLNLYHKRCLIFFSSSFVTLVYLTRTFSNSLECIYFALLIYILSKIFKHYNEFTSTKLHDLFLKRYLFNIFIFGMILCLGIFNRPTFVCFAIFPSIILAVLFLKLDIHIKLCTSIVFFLAFFCISVCIIFIDSVYYNKTNYSSMQKFKSIVTPLNFAQYNLNSENLSNHGLHPYWLHLLVNIPLVFSVPGFVLPICSIKNFIFSMKDIKCRDNKNCDRHKYINGVIEIVILFSYFIPLFLLSIIPHQEPRFIIPLIVPLCLLFNYHTLTKFKILKCIWVTSNVLCVIFYGFFHQAGVYHSMQYLNGKINNNNAIIFYKTYMPPRYLLSLEKNKNVNVFDFAEMDELAFLERIKEVAVRQKPTQIFIVMPGKLIFKQNKQNLYQLHYIGQSIKHIFPHLSTENLPELQEFQNIFEKQSPFSSKLLHLKKLYSLKILLYRKETADM